MKRYFRKTKESCILLPATAVLQGYFKLTAIRPDGRRRPLTGWFPNLITDGGLNRMGTGDFLRLCHVGSGTAVPTVTDTALQSSVAITDTTQSTVSSAQASAPFYGAQTNTYRFAAGVAEGNLSEVGVGWGTLAAPSSLYTRALILDGAQQPTTITVLADEVLDVTYQLRVIPPTTDVNGSVTDAGPAGTVHSTVTRASLVTAASGGGVSRGWGIDNIFGNSVILSDGTGARPRAFNGALGTIEQSPSGTTANSVINNITNQSYANNSLERLASNFWNLNDGNLTGGITAVQFQWRNTGAWQTSFDPAIPKDNERVLTINYKVNWARATV